VQPTLALKEILSEQTAKIIGPIAKPDIIQFAVALPKTRSRKIMRRLLRKIASGETQDFGDVSTLADPKVIEELLKEHAASKQP
jgi:acetyl-CoA synthetase